MPERVSREAELFLSRKHRQKTEPGCFEREISSSATETRFYFISIRRYFAFIGSTVA